MEFIPHEYQKYCIQHILDHKESALLLSCGLGKTAIALNAIYDLCLDSFEVSKVLVVAPLRVARDTWPAEIEKWDNLKGLTYSVVLGSEKQRLEALKKQAFVYIINRENLEWLITKSKTPFNYECVVLDELSSFKNHQTNRFKAMMAVRPRVQRIIGLTGTPAPNSLMDLWAEFKLLDMGQRLGRYITRYREEYFVPDKRNGLQVYTWKPVIGSRERIYQAISDITVSMDSADYLHMPKLVENEVPVYLDEEERAVYDELRKNMVADLNGKEIDVVNAAALSNKLLQMANGNIYDDDKNVIHIHDRKLEALEDLVEASNGNPVMVAYWFNHDLEAIKEKFPKIRELKTSKDIRDWNAGKIELAAIHPASAGHGLNLQDGGSTLIWYSMTWSLELYQQTNARLYRQGQQNTVVIHHIIAKDTIDEDVMRALRSKNETQSDLLNAVKARIGKE